MNVKMHYRFQLAAALIFMSFAADLFAQACSITPSTQTISLNGTASFSLSGSSSACDRDEYSWWDNAGHSEDNVTSVSWQYTSPGTFTVSFTGNDTDINGNPPRAIGGFATVLVTSTPLTPPVPNATIYTIPDCSSTVVGISTGGATFNPDYDFFWQFNPAVPTTANGNANSTIKLTQSQRLYLMARARLSPFAWGGPQDLGVIAVDPTPKPGTPINPQNGYRFGPGPVTLSATPVAANTLKWFASSGSEYIESSHSETIGAPSSRTFFVHSYNSARNCISIGGISITATAYSMPQITPSSTTVGGTLNVGSGYDSYTWQRPNGQITNGTPSIVATMPGSYSVVVTKSGASATASAFVSCGVDDNDGCSIIVSGSTTICAGESVTFSKGSCGGVYRDFTWSGDFYDSHQNETEISVTYSTPGVYCMSLQASCPDANGVSCPDGFDVRDSYVMIEVVAPLPPIQASASITTACQEFNTNLTVGNPQPGQQYEWYKSGTREYRGSGISLNVLVRNSDSGFFVEYGASYATSVCGVGGTYVSAFVSKTSSTPVVLSSSYRKMTLNAVPGSAGVMEYWQETSDGVSVQQLASIPITVNESGQHFIRGFNSGLGCWMAANGSNFSVDIIPPQPNVGIVRNGGSNEVYFIPPDKDFIFQYADYYWVSSANGTQGKKFSNGAKIFTSGTHYLRGKDRESGTWGTALAFDLQLLADDGYNWIATQSFDGSAGELVVAESKSYFDEMGKLLQSQSKNIERDFIFTTESLYDKYNRAVGSTLPAPILPKTFTYNNAFNMDVNGQTYNHIQFDNVVPGNPVASTRYNPAPVGSDTEGTVGWYYSINNTLEPNTPKTQYPFARTVFYEDGSGEAMLSGGVGEQLRIGANHETRSGTFPIANELDDYLTVRKTLVFQNALPMPTTLKHEAIQRVARDENGQYAVSFSDKEGKTVMTARPGNWLAVNNSVTSTSLIYFYLLQAEPVSISGGSYTITNLITNQTMTSPGATWPEGFYRITVSSGSVTANYTNHYGDIAYSFYDDAGRLLSSISPNGYQQLRMNAPLVPYADIDKSTYVYNHRGWLLSMKETDAGTTEYMYRKDGSIRFSQNEVQRSKSRFSYTHYDVLGRPIESGEYKGTAEVFNSATLKGKLEVAQQQVWTGTDIIDWVKTYYDKPNTLLASAGLPASYVQTFVRGAVSSTENVNIQTWYSYDELGRVKWMAQKPKALPRVFVAEYSYDFLGNVLTVAQKSYQAGVLKDQFYHYYTYDKDKRLTQCHTSVDGNANTKTLQAKYIYYLHGPLKRIELATQLQGIDFTYNIQGWLQSINHPDTGKDPGLDGQPGVNSGFRKDAFGLQLQYYESLIAPLQAAIPGQDDPARFHRLPELETATLKAVASNDTKKSNLRELQASLMELKRQYSTSTPNSND